MPRSRGSVSRENGSSSSVTTRKRLRSDKAVPPSFSSRDNLPSVVSGHHSSPPRPLPLANETCRRRCRAVVSTRHETNPSSMLLSAPPHSVLAPLVRGLLSLVVEDVLFHDLPSAKTLDELIQANDVLLHQMVTEKWLMPPVPSPSSTTPPALSPRRNPGQPSTKRQQSDDSSAETTSTSPSALLPHWLCCVLQLVCFRSHLRIAFQAIREEEAVKQRRGGKSGEGSTSSAEHEQLWWADSLPLIGQMALILKADLEIPRPLRVWSTRVLLAMAEGRPPHSQQPMAPNEMVTVLPQLLGEVVAGYLLFSIHTTAEETTSPASASSSTATTTTATLTPTTDGAPSHDTGSCSPAALSKYYLHMLRAAVLPRLEAGIVALPNVSSSCGKPMATRHGSGTDTTPSAVPPPQEREGELGREGNPHLEGEPTQRIPESRANVHEGHAPSRATPSQRHSLSRGEGGVAHSRLPSIFDVVSEEEEASKSAETRTPQRKLNKTIDDEDLLVDNTDGTPKTKSAPSTALSAKKLLLSPSSHEGEDESEVEEPVLVLKPRPSSTGPTQDPFLQDPSAEETLGEEPVAKKTMSRRMLEKDERDAEVGYLHLLKKEHQRALLIPPPALSQEHTREASAPYRKRPRDEDDEATKEELKKDSHTQEREEVMREPQRTGTSSEEWDLAPRHDVLPPPHLLLSSTPRESPAVCGPAATSAVTPLPPPPPSPTSTRSPPPVLPAPRTVETPVVSRWNSPQDCRHGEDYTADVPLLTQPTVTEMARMEEGGEGGRDSVRADRSGALSRPSSPLVKSTGANEEEVAQDFLSNAEKNEVIEAGEAFPQRGAAREAHETTVVEPTVPNSSTSVTRQEVVAAPTAVVMASELQNTATHFSRVRPALNPFLRLKELQKAVSSIEKPPQTPTQVIKMEEDSHTANSSASHHQNKKGSRSLTPPPPPPPSPPQPPRTRSSTPEVASSLASLSGTKAPQEPEGEKIKRQYVLNWRTQCYEPSRYGQ